MLESGAPFWWRESDEEPDGIDVRLNDPTTLALALTLALSLTPTLTLTRCASMTRPPGRLARLGRRRAEGDLFEYPTPPRDASHSHSLHLTCNFVSIVAIWAICCLQCLYTCLLQSS